MRRNSRVSTRGNKGGGVCLGAIENAASSSARKRDKRAVGLAIHDDSAQDLAAHAQPKNA